MTALSAHPSDLVVCVAVEKLCLHISVRADEPLVAQSAYLQIVEARTILSPHIITLVYVGQN